MNARPLSWAGVCGVGDLVSQLQDMETINSTAQKSASRNILLADASLLVRVVWPRNVSLGQFVALWTGFIHQLGLENLGRTLETTMRWGLLLLLVVVVEEVVGGKKYIIKTEGREVEVETKTKSQSSKLKGPKVGKSRIKSKRSKMKAFDIEKGQDYTEAFSQLPLDKPEKEFTAKLPGGATATLSSCLHLHKLVAKGREEEVVTRKKEICSEQGLLEFAGEVDGVTGVSLI